MFRYGGYVLIVVSATLMIYHAVGYHWESSGIGSISARVMEGGEVLLNITLVPRNGTAFLALPRGASIIGVYEGNVEADYTVRRGVVYVHNVTAATLVLRIPAFARKVGGNWVFMISTNATYTLVELPRDTTVLNVDPPPERIGFNEYLRLEFLSGEVTIIYTRKNSPENSRLLPDHETGAWEELEYLLNRLGIISFFIILFPLAASTLVTAQYILKIYRKIRKKRTGLLTYEEKRILNFLEHRGGSARQRDIVRELGLPKTSAWRIVRRMEEKGLVRIEKQGMENIVHLK